jgi:2-aminoadipate transaminase
MPTFSSSVNSLRSSEIRDLMSLATKPGIISFAGGMPDNDLFPVEIIDEIYNNLTLAEKQVAMQYGPTSGLPTLLESLTNYLGKKGLPVNDNKLVITTGSLQAINILAKAFIDPGDNILVENPCFIGAISAFKSYQAELNTVPLTPNGISIEHLKKSLSINGRKPKFLYITPNFHNPAGTLYTSDVKKEIIEMFSDIDIPIIEDDCYSALSFYDEDKAHLKTLKEYNPAGTDICYLSSFSKILGPGLRLGWMLVPDHIYKKCELIKQSFDACSPSFTQVIADKFLRTGAVYNYVDSVKPEYKKRALAMLDAMDKYFPSYTTWTKPRGGFYIWVQLPEKADATEILKRAIEKGAVFVTGKTFDPAGLKNNAMRISYCNTSVEKINTGIPMIAEAIKEVCG